ncbi:hypothetical protein Tco_1567005 [Tanacetum coccineum]
MKLMQFLMGLDDTYMQLRSNILSRDPLPDDKGAYVLISSEESHKSVVTFAPGRNVVAPQLTTQSTPQIPHLQTSYQIPHIQRRLVIGESNNLLGRRGKRRPPLLFEDILQHLQKKIRVAARELEVSPSTLGKRFKVFFPTETWPGERYPWLRLRPRTSWPHKPPYTIPSIFEMHSPTSHAQSSHTGPTWQEESRLVILAMFGGIPYRFDVPRSANIDGIKIQIFSFYGLSLMEYQLVYLFNVEGYAPIDSDNQWTACIAEYDARRLIFIELHIISRFG